MRYWATFKGVTKGALGNAYRYQRMCEGSTPHEAEVSLYTTHEHISDLKLLNVGDASRAKVGDVLEPIDHKGNPTGYHYQITSLTNELPNAITGQNAFRDGLHPLAKDGLYIYREVGGTPTS
jgi:hypothetical protein